MPQQTSEQSAPEPTVEEESCESLTRPIFNSSFHLPKTSWHEHRDGGISVEEDTEYQAFAALTISTLMELSGGNNRLVVGYLGDMLNTMPKNLRLAMMHVLANGLGLDIQTAADAPDTIEVNLVPRYEALTPSMQKPPSLMTPGNVTVNQELIEKIKREGLRG